MPHQNTVEETWREALQLAEVRRPWEAPTVIFTDDQIIDTSGKRVRGVTKFNRICPKTGKMIFEERIYIYVDRTDPTFQDCLLHEMLHCIWMRRVWVSPSFHKRNPDSEAYVLRLMRKR